MRLFRFRRFGTRLLALLLGLLFAVLGLTYLFVSRANLSTALAHSEANLTVGAGIFDETIRQRIESLSSSARVLARDYAILQTLSEDRATLASMLETYTGRVRASTIVLLEPEGNLRAASRSSLADADIAPFRALVNSARDKDPAEDSGFAYLAGELHVMVVVPIYAPYPEVAAWFGLAFPIDAAVAQKIRDATHLELTLISTDSPTQPRVLATTLPEELARILARRAGTGSRPGGREITTVDTPGERYVTLFKSERLLGAPPITVALQRPLSGELAAARELERKMLVISMGALALATLIALWIARGVSQPVLQLAAHTRVVAGGDYTQHLDLRRDDELGLLAESFNAMSDGLAERDRVRDLLDKNVSPEVAAQLLRDGAALGGEERDVTILFADLRGFTTMSERRAPRELLTLLNRYLDRMSAEIERNGGVIDKFIGDEIMALFGAPISQSDAANRAVAAALGMQRALVELNREFAAETQAKAGDAAAPPLPQLAVGIGINTARVVAGNMGSHRRLNYSVIGDGVNVAARLQSLTRNAEFRASIIISAATLQACRSDSSLPVPTSRSLGRAPVKGRAEAVEIFAIE